MGSNLIIKKTIKKIMNKSNARTWVLGKDYPEWMDEIGVSMISEGYLLPEENVFQAFRRVSKAAARRLKKKELQPFFYEAMVKNWLCLASPVLSNMGTERGLPISCYGIDIEDSIPGIADANSELMRLASQGGGVGIGLSRLRHRGAPISGNGHSEGVVPWCKIHDSIILATNQGNVRRGAASENLHWKHPDIKEFLQIRRPKGDVNRQCLNLHQCIVLDNEFFELLNNGDEHVKGIWIEILKTRIETGEPYLMFIDNINNQNPLAYKQNNLQVTMTNICLTGDAIINICVEGQIFECRLDELPFFLDKFDLVEVLSYNEETKTQEYKQILDFAMTSPNAEVYEIEDEDSKIKIRCTPEHKIMTTNRGYVMAKDLSEDDKLLLK